MTHRPGLRRVLLYSHDTYGLGHLRRNLALAEFLLGAHPHGRVVLMTGSPVTDRFALPDRLDVVQLPPAVKIDNDEYVARDPRWSPDLIRRSRSAIMCDTARRFRPDIMLVDHAPHGMKNELLPVFATLRGSSPDTRIVLGLRDIIDSPEVVRADWAAHGVYDTLDSTFDRIIVYGDQNLFDVADAYALPPEVRDKVYYSGYINRHYRLADAPAPRSDVVLGMAGGGGDGVEILRATIEACRTLAQPGIIMTGPLMSPEDRANLDALASSVEQVKVVDFVSDPSALMRIANAVVTMGGYNSLCELVALDTPTVVVPRVAPRREQDIRAHLFASLQVVEVEPPGPDLAGRLARAITRLAHTSEPRARRPLNLNGLETVNELLLDEMKSATTARTGSSPSQPSKVDV